MSIDVLIILPRNPHADRRPERILLHRKYDDDSLEFDIALIKINPVEISPHIKPISLPRPKQCGRKRKKTKRKEGRSERNPSLLLRRKQQIRIEGRKGKLKRLRKRLREENREKHYNEEDDEAEEDDSGDADEEGSGEESGSGEEEECNIKRESRPWSFS